jgi:hypothetical protein
METLYFLQMLVEQERSRQETTEGIQEQVQQYMIQGWTFTYLDDDTNSYHQPPKHVNS